MNDNITDTFSKHLIDIILDMAGILLKREGETYKDNEEISSFGVSSVVAYIGDIKGRVLIDMEGELAVEIAKRIMREEYRSPKENMVLSAISELNNIIAGNGVTELNDKLNLKLRLAPPIVFTGRDVTIAVPKLSSHSIMYNTEFGKIRLNVAFEGGEGYGC